MDSVVYGNANALLASLHAEGAAEVDFILQFVFVDEALKRFNDLTGAL